MHQGGRLRIGELSKRVGVSPERLRAWETRYDLLQPERTSGGMRLYSEADEERVRRMCAQMAAGVTASEAARIALLDAAPPLPPAADNLEVMLGQLANALDALDEPAAQGVMDMLLSSAPLETVLGQVILPLLHNIGARWAAEQVTIAQEHFATNLIGSRLRALARGWGQGVGPRVVLACPPDERHDLGLVCFGLAAHRYGWRVTFLGADTPMPEVARAMDEQDCALAVLSAVMPCRFSGVESEIRALAATQRVAIGGAGATPELASALGAEELGGDLVAAAAELTP